MKWNKISYWLIFHLLITFLFLLFGKGSINTSLFSILPDSNPVKQLSHVERSLSVKLNSNLIILVGHSDFSTLKSITDDFTKELSDQNLVKDLQYKIDSSSLSLIQSHLYKYRYHFLSDQVRSLLIEQNTNALSDRAFFTLSSPVSMGSLDHLKEDPFLLANDHLQSFFNSRIMGNMSLSIRDSLMTKKYDDKTWVLIKGRTYADGAAVELKENPIPSILEMSKAYENKYEGIEFLFSGVPFHSYDSAQKSQKEITLLSTISTLFIIILLLLVFRSFQPLLATIIAISAGLFCGLALTLIIFKEIHIFTIVFGTSLIGISVDYSFHFFTEWAQQMRTDKIIKKIIPGISIGLITTLLSYGAFTFSSFPLLQQMALFSISGLLSTYVSVLFLYPILKEAKLRSKISAYNSGQALLKFSLIPSKFSPFLNRLILLVLLIFAILGLRDFKLNNNIRDLYKMDPQLYNWERKSAAILEHGSSGIYVIIEGDSLQDNLEKEELLCSYLNSFPVKTSLESYLSLSSFLPSELKQNENLALSKNFLIPKMLDQLLLLGYSQIDYEKNLKQFEEQKNNFISIIDLNSINLNSLTDSLDLGKIDGKYYTSILLFGIKDFESIKEVSNKIDGIYLVNKAEDISKTLHDLSLLAIAIIAISYVIIFVSLIFRYKFKGAFRIVFIPIAASILTLALISLLQMPVNLFVVVGLILIPGMGTDYIILISESHKDDPVVLLSITLSMLTSVLAFGLLGFTSIAGTFGLTVSFGVFMTYMLTLFFNSNPSISFKRK